VPPPARGWTVSATVSRLLRADRARACHGLCYGDPAKRAAYLEHQYRGDTPRNAASMGSSQSGCLLHIRGTLGLEGLDDDATFRGRLVDIFDGAYVDEIGMVEGLLLTWVQQRGGGALSYRGPERPELRTGEVVVIGEGLATHGLIVLEQDGDQVVSSDGGQPDGRNGGRPTAIAERTRTLARGPGGTWTLGGRVLRWGWY
jgi:hypothetical protein